jgi:hypothetical protein
VTWALGHPTSHQCQATQVIDETCAMLYEGKDIRQAVKDLMARELKAED